MYLQRRKLADRIFSLGHGQRSSSPSSLRKGKRSNVNSRSKSKFCSTEQQHLDPKDFEYKRIGNYMYGVKREDTSASVNPKPKVVVHRKQASEKFESARIKESSNFVINQSVRDRGSRTYLKSAFRQDTPMVQTSDNSLMMMGKKSIPSISGFCPSNFVVSSADMARKDSKEKSLKSAFKEFVGSRYLAQDLPYMKTLDCFRVSQNPIF